MEMFTVVVDLHSTYVLGWIVGLDFILPLVASISAGTLAVNEFKYDASVKFALSKRKSHPSSLG